MNGSTTPPVPAHLRNYVAANYGGALRNSLYEPGITCKVCFAPVAEGFAVCFRCKQHATIAGKADRVGSIIYAVSNEQSHHVMRSYKSIPAVEEARLVVFLLAWGALAEHTPCLEKMTGREVTHWASVPTLPAKPGVHALHTLIAPNAPGLEISLRAASSVPPSNLRDINGNHYHAAAEIRAGAHVLIIDDTWTGGGHAQSAALAVRRSGAETVSILNVARFLAKGWTPTDDFLRNHARQDFDSNWCPWTGGSCP